MRKSASDTRTAILNVALQLFLKKGYKDVSYQDLIKETGLSKGAIYHHFKSKEDLLVSVFKFFMESSQQAVGTHPEKQVKDFKSFRKLFIDSKKEQLKGFKNLMGAKTVKFNKLLFFLEAISENDKLKKIIVELLSHEMKFLEKCFIGLKKHNKLPHGKDPALLAQGLFWMLQGAEMIAVFIENNEQEKNLMKIYNKTFDDFLKII